MRNSWSAVDSLAEYTRAIMALVRYACSAFNCLLSRLDLTMSGVQVPETARLCRLKHAPERQQPVLHAAADVVGERAIRRHLEALNLEVT